LYRDETNTQQLCRSEMVPSRARTPIMLRLLQLAILPQGWYVQCSAGVFATAGCSSRLDSYPPAPLWGRKGTEHCAVNG
jgi:hypothetical protein